MANDGPRGQHVKPGQLRPLLHDKHHLTKLSSAIARLECMEPRNVLKRVDKGLRETLSSLKSILWQLADFIVWVYALCSLTYHLLK
jgi:hypothetical protein